MVEPFTTQKPLGSDNPRDLWKYMAMVEEKTGGQVLALAHNGNLSNGIMFPIVESFTGKKIDRAYAENRMRWEPLYECTQIKGDGETHPFLSPNDEFANFERWDKGNLDLSVLKKPEMLEFEGAIEDGDVINPHGMDPATMLRFVSAIGGFSGKIVGFAYGVTPQFPSFNYADANYWVDLLFTAN